MGHASPTSIKLRSVFDRLLECYGPQHWWPAETPFEVMVGAVLTQSAAWGNIEKDIVNLKLAVALSPEALRRINILELGRLIYPSVYYNAKAKKLKALVEWLEIYDDDLTILKTRATGDLRRKLLSVHGIGPETADSILLYALGQPVFVIDAYTRRLFSRLGIVPAKDSYDGWQELFTASRPRDTAMYNEYHALIVKHAKEKCRKKPQCTDCRLRPVCPAGLLFTAIGTAAERLR